MRQRTRWLACLAGVLAVAGAAQAQQRIGSTGTTGGGFTGTSGGGGFSGTSGGGFSGTSGGGFTGTSGGGFTGSSGGGFSGSGGFAGGGSGTFAGGTTTTRGTTGRATYGQTSVIGRFYGSPYSLGYVGTSTSSTSSSPAQQGIRPYPQTLSFGQAVYQSTGTGATGLGGALGGVAGGTTGLGGRLGTTGLGTGVAGISGAGSSAIGVRRAPAYLTTLGPTLTNGVTGGSASTFTAPAIEIPPQPPPSAVNVQSTITSARGITSRDNITASTNNSGSVVLSGQVTSERDRRLAMAYASMAPNVREVTSQLQVQPRR